MSESGVAVWAAGIAAWVVFVAYVIWISRQVWKDRLVRCPETGAVALVGVDHVSAGDGSAPRLVVRRCGLWPSRAGCARGCLARYEESAGFAPGFNALRPFDRI